MQSSLEVGNRIRNIRENMHLNRDKFSEMLDISEVFLGQIERGERSVSIKTLTKLVNSTGISSDFILFGNSSDNQISKKVENLLNALPENVQEYIYEITRFTYNHFKETQNNK